MIKSKAKYHITYVLFLSLLSCNNSNRDFVSLSFYDNGQVKLKCQLIDSVADGKCIKYFQNGKVEYIQNHKNGQLRGNTEHFHSNGQLHWEHNYEESGKINGFVQYYDSLGKIYLDANYLESMLEGVSYLYFPNGSKKQITYYKKNKRHGLFKQFYPTGEIKYESEYKDGLLIAHKEFDPQGELVDEMIRYTMEYKSGSLLIEVLNPRFDQRAIELYRTDLSGNILEKLGLFFMEKNSIKLDLEESYFDDFALFGVILDTENLDGKENVVKSRVEFTYPSG